MANQDHEECKEVFLLYDRAGDLKIHVEDVGEVLRAMGSNPTLSELGKMEQQFKLGKDKRITFDEFWPVFQATKPRQLTPATKSSFVECFKVFDRNCNGTISAAELRQLLTNLGDKLTAKEVDILLSGLEDNNGLVNYEEFVHTITQD